MYTLLLYKFKFQYSIVVLCQIFFNTTADFLHEDLNSNQIPLIEPLDL